MVNESGDAGIDAIVHQNAGIGLGRVKGGKLRGVERARREKDVTRKEVVRDHEAVHDQGLDRELGQGVPGQRLATAWMMWKVKMGEESAFRLREEKERMINDQENAI